ncbi:MAG TPA: hypothetical protein VKJ47_13590, partial [Candidatus Binatia bacterium]|nr:hypothetical protein [Candidatus Binatia bacterium]
MAARKKPATAKARTTRKRAPSEYKGKALAGRAQRGREWNPAQPEAAAPALPEVKEPRPYTSRYPIPNEEFEALKAAAPKSRLARVTVERSRDSGRGKEELAARAISPAVLEAGLEPVAAPSGAANFAGIAATGWIPPDCTMAAGPQHVLLSVNSSVAIYGKAGGAPLLQRTLTQWFSNVAQGMTIFDPKALYDQHAGRWVLLAVAVQNSPRNSLHLLSVSSSANPLGTWRNYRFNAMLDGSTATSNWADYPALGVDNQAFYVTSNMFRFGGGFQYAKIRVIPKAGPYAGGAAPYFDFVRMRNADNTLAFTVQPCHTFGAPQVEYLVNSGFPSGNVLTLWRITNPTVTPTLTRAQVPVSPYSLPPNAEQSGGAPPLNTGDVRVLHAVFRGDSVWTVFTTAHNWGGSSNRAAIQWCQIRAAAPAIVQQGVYGAANFHYFYPAACPDNNGNMTMVFSRSGPSRFGSILYTGRRSTDPLGTLQPSALLKAGVAHYSALDDGGRNRWGDYNGVAADPANP